MGRFRKKEQTIMSKVKYGNHVPKTLRAYADRHADQIEEITWSARGGAYDAFLRPGWRHCDHEHTIVKETATELIAELRNIMPCDCEDCAKGVEG